MCNLIKQEKRRQHLEKIHNHAHVVVILLQVLALDHDDCPVNPEAEIAFLLSAKEGYLRVLMLVQGADDHFHGVVPFISANPLDYIWWKHVLLLNQVIFKTVGVLKNGDIPFNLHFLMLCSWALLGLLPSSPLNMRIVLNLNRTGNSIILCSNLPKQTKHIFRCVLTNVIFVQYKETLTISEP